MTVYILEHGYSDSGGESLEVLGVYLTQAHAEAAFRASGHWGRPFITESELFAPRLEDPNMGDGLDKNGDCIVCGR